MIQRTFGIQPQTSLATCEPRSVLSPVRKPAGSKASHGSKRKTKSLKVQQCLARQRSVIAELTIDGRDIMEAEPLLLELKIEVDAPLERRRTKHESSAPPMEAPKARPSAGLSLTA
jgi:hypothetical protein